MKTIELADGRFALVDDSDFEHLNQFNWSCANGYPRTVISGKHVKMHRMLMGATEKQIVDHADRNKLNNQRHNLRFASKQQNTVNSRIWSHNTSGRKGVTWDSERKKWKAQMKVNGIEKFIGRFSHLRDAAMAYDSFSLRIFGEFSSTNFSLGIL